MRPKSMPPISSKANDNWQTPIKALEPLFPYLDRNWTIWEPAQGKGYLTEGLRSKGFKVIGSDILTDQDFLSWQPDYFDCIITNPPFSLKQQFIERAYRLHKPFAFLVPLTTFETSRRQALFKEYGLEVILFGDRIIFENEAGSSNGRPYFACVWFTNWLGIGSQLTFWDLKPAKIGMI